MHSHVQVKFSKTVVDRSTNWEKGLCDGKNLCSGTVHTSVLTDPYSGCTKTSSWWLIVLMER